VETFLDFGLFELLVALGIVGLARVVFARRWLGVAFVMASIVAPAALFFLNQADVRRWLAVGCLGTALINSAVVLGALQRGDVPLLKIPPRRRE
jgi:hypothetical protein